MRDFNTTGPCKPSRHYMIPPLERSSRVLTRIQREKYLAVSGPRQSGKTSLLNAIVDSINADGWGRAALISCEPADQKYGITTMEEAERALIPTWMAAINEQLPEVPWPTAEELLAGVGDGVRCSLALTQLAKRCDKPLVLVVDEVDCLPRIPFGRLLRQIREGFARRPKGFPHSIVLAGMRHLRDHDIAMGGDGSGSPFNIVEFISVANFSRDEIARLYSQHTDDTGQGFSDAAIEMVWEQTRGQPWLVNAIANTCVSEIASDPQRSIDMPDIEEAIRRVEASNPTHLTSLGQRLSEDRVLRVVAPAIAGEQLRDVPADDIRYVRELGILEERAGRRERHRAAFAQFTLGTVMAVLHT